MKMTKEEFAAKLAARNAIADELNAMRKLDAIDPLAVQEKREEMRKIDLELDAAEGKLTPRVEARAGDGDYTANGRIGDVKASAPIADRVARAAGDRYVIRERPDVPNAILSRGESFGSHQISREYMTQRAELDRTVKGVYGGSLGQMVRTITDSGTSAIVPSDWAADVIDLARNYSAVIKAGASIIPMTTNVLNVGRVTGDPTPAFRAEGSAITPSDFTLDNVTLTAKTVSVLVQASMEWIQDAENGDALIMNEMAKAMALKVDFMALYGGIVTANAWPATGAINWPNPPNPRGIAASLLANRPANILGGGANGVPTLTRFNELIALDYLLEDLNETPTALLMPTKLLHNYALMVDTQNRPLDIRQTDLRDLPIIPTNQVLSNYTQGTNTTAADAFLADWSKLLIGQRMDFTIQRLNERYADAGTIGFVMHWRGDIGLARNSAFGIYRALNGSA